LVVFVNINKKKKKKIEIVTNFCVKRDFKFSRILYECRLKERCLDAINCLGTSSLMKRAQIVLVTPLQSAKICRYQNVPYRG